MIIRTYGCDTCGETFEVTLDNSDAPEPDCPYCRDVVLQWRPGMFNVKTNKSRAMDIAQDIAEKDYGLTNMRDNMREGDIAAVMPTAPKTADVDAIMQVQQEIAAQTGQVMNEEQKRAAAGFWAGGAAKAAAMPPTQALGIARGAAKEADAMGANPMKLLHAAGKKGHLPNNYRIVARDKL